VFNGKQERSGPDREKVERLILLQGAKSRQALAWRSKVLARRPNVVSIAACNAMKDRVRIRKTNVSAALRCGWLPSLEHLSQQSLLRSPGCISDRQAVTMERSGASRDGEHARVRRRLSHGVRVIIGSCGGEPVTISPA
jgi:hypothetical protein